jgi:RimJ/RimL family protein N-acetyltransferase
MALAAWWVGDDLLNLMPLADFHVCLAEDDTELAQLNRLSIDEVMNRRNAGHCPYIGYVGEVPVTYGWAATREASIGELNLVFPIPSEDRYLWDFATLPEWQGKGLYPRLLQGILQDEQAERFWIIHAPENLPSGAGMQKAGFQPVGQLSFRSDGSVGLIALDMRERAQKGAALLGVPLIEEELSPCWRCMDQVVCTCKFNPEQCSCAVKLQAHS